jgi:hypothetical protein
MGRLTRLIRFFDRVRVASEYGVWVWGSIKDEPKQDGGWVLGDVNSSTKTFVLAKNASFCVVEGVWTAVGKLGVERIVEIREVGGVFSFSLFADDARRKRR